MQNNKVVLVGATGVGKTTFTKFLLTGTFDPKYILTSGVAVHNIPHIQRNGQSIDLKVWDTAGHEQMRGLVDGYFIGGKCAVIFLDATENLYMLETRYKEYLKELLRGGSIDKDNIIVAVNKMDVAKEAIPEGSLNFPHRTFYISVKNNVGITQLLDAISNFM